MNIKNVVKVMNFHSLLRVERSREAAKKYTYLGDTVADMIDNIVNNRNIMLDGFCANLNSNISRQMHEDGNVDKIIVGRKIRTTEKDEGNILLQMSREEFEADKQPIFDILDEGFRKKKYSKINLVYNHYYSSSEVEFKNKVLFPLPEHLKSDRTYQEDFAYEGEIEPLLTNLIILYMQYELVIAGEVSSAALNITRQNTTTESLKKIDEREESRQMLERRQEREKEFGKVLDNYTKLNQY